MNTFQLRVEVDNQAVLLKREWSKGMGVAKKVLQNAEVVEMAMAENQDFP